MLFRLFPESAEKKSDRKEDALKVILLAVISFLSLILGQHLLSALLFSYHPLYVGAISLFGASLGVMPIFLYSRVLKKISGESMYIRKNNAVKHGFFGLFLGVLLAVLTAVILLFAGAVSFSFYESADLFLILLYLLAYLVQGAAEELLCRGLLMGALCRRFGGKIGAVFSAAAFALFHASNPSVGIFAMLNIFLFGLLLASVTQKTKGISFACLMHAGWNFSLTLLGVQVSGVEAGGVLLFQRSNIPWLSGGAFGMEASPALSVLLLLSLSLLGLIGIKQK